MTENENIINNSNELNNDNLNNLNNDHNNDQNNDNLNNDNLNNNDQNNDQNQLNEINHQEINLKLSNALQNILKEDFFVLQEQLNTIKHNQSILLELMENEVYDMDSIVEKILIKPTNPSKDLSTSVSTGKIEKKSMEENGYFSDVDLRDSSIEDEVARMNLTFSLIPTYEKKLAAMRKQMQGLPKELKDLQEKVQKLYARVGG